MSEPERRSLEDYGPTSAMRELELVHAIEAAVVRHEPCACGRPLVQRRGETIEDVVRQHQLTARHRAWRVETGV